MSYEHAAEERERIRREIDAIERSLLEKGVRIPSSGSEDDSTNDSCGERSDEAGRTDFLQRVSDFDATNVTLHQVQVEEVRAGTDSSEEDEEALLPQDAPTCLSINRLYQELLQERLRALDGLLQQNWDQQEALKRESCDTDLASGAVCSAKKHIHLGSFLKPYFRDPSSGLGPPDNPETKNMASCGHKNFPAYDLRRWTDREKASLREAVQMDSLHSRLQPIVTRLNVTEVKMEKMGEDEDKSAIMRSIKLMKQDINRVKNLPVKELLGDKDDRHDWLKIANFDMAGKRSPTEVEKFWRHRLHPSVNMTPWQSSEDNNLHELIVQHGHNAWGEVASRLRTNRTAFQCLSRFQRMNHAFRRKGWTEEENAALSQLVEAMRIGEHIPFTRIAFFMDGRSPSQISSHWNTVLKPGLRHGAWTSAEDELLLRAVVRWGERWYLVAQDIPGRADFQCRERYSNSLASGISKGAWTDDEVKNLQRLVSHYGSGQWAAISKALGTRSYGQCYKRWKRFNNRESLGGDEVTPLSRKRKRALPSLDEEEEGAEKVRRAGAERRKRRLTRRQSVSAMSTPSPSPPSPPSPPSSSSSSPSSPSASVGTQSDSDGADENDEVVDASGKRKCSLRHCEDKRPKLLLGGAAGRSSSPGNTKLCIPSIDLWLHPNSCLNQTTSDPAGFQENNGGTEMREVSESLGLGQVRRSRGQRGRTSNLDHKISQELKRWSHLATTVSHKTPPSQSTVETQATAAKLSAIEVTASVEETAAAQQTTAVKGKPATSSRSLADVLGDKMGRLNLNTKCIFELLLKVFDIDHVRCLRMINETQLGPKFTMLPCLKTAKAALARAGAQHVPKRQSVRALLHQANPISQLQPSLVLTPIRLTGPTQAASLMVGQGGSTKPLAPGFGKSSILPFTVLLHRPLVPSLVSDGTLLGPLVSGGSAMAKPTLTAGSPVKPGNMVLSQVGGIPVISSLANASNVLAGSVVKPLVCTGSPIPHTSGIVLVPPGSVVTRPATASQPSVCASPSVTSVFATIVTSQVVSTRSLVCSPASTGSVVRRPTVDTKALVTSLLNAKMLAIPPMKPLVTTGPIVTPISATTTATTVITSGTTPAIAALTSGTTPAITTLVSGTTPAVTTLTMTSSTASSAHISGIPSPTSSSFISGAPSTSATLISGRAPTTSRISRTPSVASVVKEAWLLFGRRDEQSGTPSSVWRWGRVPLDDDDDDDDDDEDLDDDGSIETWVAQLKMRGSLSDSSLTSAVTSSASFSVVTAAKVAASTASTGTPPSLASTVDSSTSLSLACAVTSSISSSLALPALASASSPRPSVASSSPLVAPSPSSISSPLPSISSPLPSFTSVTGSSVTSSLPSSSYPLPSVTSSHASSVTSSLLSTTSSLSSSLPPLLFPPAPTFSSPLPPCSYLPPCGSTLRALKTLLQRRQTLLLLQKKQQQQQQPPPGELNITGNTTTTTANATTSSSSNNVDNSPAIPSPSPMASPIKDTSAVEGIDGGPPAGSSLPFALGAVDFSQNSRETDHCIDHHQSHGPPAQGDRQWREEDVAITCLRRRFLATFMGPAVLATTPLLRQHSEFFRHQTRPSDGGGKSTIRGRGRSRRKGRGRTMAAEKSVDDGRSNVHVGIALGPDGADVADDNCVVGGHGVDDHGRDGGHGVGGDGHGVGGDGHGVGGDGHGVGGDGHGVGGDGHGVGGDGHGVGGDGHGVGGDGHGVGGDGHDDGGSARGEVDDGVGSDGNGSRNGGSGVNAAQCLEAAGDVGVRGSVRAMTRGRGRVRVRGGIMGRARRRARGREGVGSEVQPESLNM